MRVFLSWSGPRSNQVATALRTFLKGILQRTDPWMSAEDIGAGQRWFTEVSGQLEQSSVGLLCLTRDNLASTWLHFEAGALSKKIDKSLVCPYLLDMEPTDVSGPLAAFQCVRATEEGTRKIVRTINGALGEARLDDTTLNEAFQLWWPKLEAKLKAIPEPAQLAAMAESVRPDRGLLEEILTIVRRMGEDQRRTQTFDRLFDTLRVFPSIHNEAEEEGRSSEALDAMLRLLEGPNAGSLRETRADFLKLSTEELWSLAKAIALLPLITRETIAAELELATDPVERLRNRLIAKRPE